MKSWRREMKLLLVSIVFGMVAFVFLVNLQYYFQITEDYKKENAQTNKQWCNSVGSRLTAMKEHLSELMLLIYDNVELRQGSPIMEYSMTTRCLGMMEDKLAVNSDLDCVFVLDKESEIFLFAGSINMLTNEAVQAKSFLKNSNLNSTSTIDYSWRVAQVGQGNYFLRSVSLGKYVVGGLSRFSKYDISKTMNVLGEEYSCMIEYENELLHVSGEDWTGNFSTTQQNVISTNLQGVSFSSVPLARVSATVILAASQMPTWEYMLSSMWLVLLGGFVCVVLYIILALKMNRMVSQPTEVLLLAMKKLQAGDTEHQITQKPGSIEFKTVFDSFNKMSWEIRRARIEAYETQLSEQKNELAYLRAQIRPHFFLNAITTVSNMTYLNSSEDIRAYLGALAKYIRYMLNMKSRMISLKDELSHIENYIQMQRIKFPDSIDAFIGCPPEIAQTKIPYLLLFSVIENTFKHAMSLYMPLSVILQCERVEEQGFFGIRIVVEDNGVGFSAEVLRAFSPSGEMPEAKDHFGLSNVSRTLQLVYNRKDLLRLSNSEANGAHVELWIPCGHDDEKEDMQ